MNTRGVVLFILVSLAFTPILSAEEWAYLDNYYLRIGVDKSRGACIGYFAPKGSQENLLDHFDTGRFIQQSYYGDPDDSKWVDKPWVYNPVQGGSYQNQPSKVTEFRSNDKTLFAKITPRNWAGGQLLDEVTMTETISLEDYFAKIEFQMNYAGNKTHKPRQQELPAVFVHAEYDTLVTYTGNSPWTGEELHRRKPSFPNESVTMNENWVAYVNQDDIGIGLYVPGIEKATCYRYQEANSACSYVAPIKEFALTPGLQHQYTVYLTCGSIEQIRLRFKVLHASSVDSASK
ncbi:hypothetical protein C5Y96_18845 [Blastopirellula marina]|uniref:Uncharacterized protein n=1 Tax=Blastopirellula marina TaxID=124 RepID=A0A2S8F611_9BACT|nr:MULTISPECIES: hypothetical protein [Pirellulaceae]PQO27587.1 hypothetical protein C5Y96_18845 [Blastopirellula marina]RCS48124.1 hypothetical protein DTL36_18870 [Bremerella cremea]